MKRNKIMLWVAAIAAALGISTAAYAVFPTTPVGEEINFRLNTLMSNLYNAAQGSIVYFSATDTPNDLAPPATDNYALLYDTDSDVPYWGAASSMSGIGTYSKTLYSSLTASTAHTGATTAETTKMPATAEGTAATSIGSANLTAGAEFDYNVWVDATGDADGDETLTVNVYFGSQLVGTTGAIPIDGATDLILTGRVKIEAAGASVAGEYWSVNNSYPGVATSAAATFTAFDTTATQAFAVKLDWGGTTDAADTAAVEQVGLEVRNYD